MTEEDILNTEEAAELLKCSPIYHPGHAKAGLIPGRKRGGMAFLQARSVAWLRGKEGNKE